MLQVKSLVLYFFFLILKVFFDLTPDVVYKQSGFLKTLLKKSFKFVLYEGSNSVLLNLDLMLLPAEINFIILEVLAMSK